MADSESAMCNTFSKIACTVIAMLAYTVISRYMKLTCHEIVTEDIVCQSQWAPGHLLIARVQDVIILRDKLSKVVIITWELS